MKKTLFISTLVLSSCNLLDEDGCYDRGQLWDQESKICSDFCVRQSGIFDVQQKRCEIPSSSDKIIKENDLAKAVQRACLNIQNLLHEEFSLKNLSGIGHVHSLHFDYARLAPITYTDKYNFGQDGVCKYAGKGEEKYNVLIRKNAWVKSRYSTSEFDILKIEGKQLVDQKMEIIWERD